MVEYESYQKSPVRWCEKFPSKWKFERARNLYRKENRSVRDIDKVVTCFRDGQVTLRENRRTTGFTESIKEIGYQGIRKGDLVIHVMDAFAGAIGVSDSDGKGSPIYSVCTAKTDVNNYYYAYLLRETARNGYIKSLYRGIRERSSDFRFDVFANELYPVPPRAEQDQIVRLLDWKVSKINKLIGIRKKEIQELEELKRSRIGSIIMGQFQTQKKKSDILWVDAIPLNWKEKSLRKYAYERCIKNDGMVEDNLLSLSYGKVIDKDINTTDGLLPVSFEGYQIVEPGDIILRLTDLQNDHKSLRTGLVTQRGIITSAYTCLETRGDILPEFLQLELHVADLCKVFYGMGGGVRQSIGFKDIKRMLIAIPSLSEQHRILDLIHGIDAPIDKQKEQYLNIINELEELKKVIISDVVTGKIDVRNVTVPEYEHVDDIVDDDSENNEEAETDGEET